MDKVWVLVADGARARILGSEGRVGRSLTELDDLVHPETRLHEGDLSDDRPGRSWGHGGEGRHAMDDPTHPHDKERDTFAREIAARLLRALNDNAYQHLVVVAPSGFLGRLRAHFDARVSARVSAEVNADIVRERPDAIRTHLPDFLY